MEYRVTRPIEPRPKRRRTKPHLTPAQTTCPCGQTIRAMIRVPTKFSPSVHKLSCAACDSQFELASVCKPDGGYNSHFTITHLSEEACRKLRGEGA